MHESHRFAVRASSAPSLIAWLSLCILAAAWGRTLDSHLQVQWSEIGAFGLVAAVGLETINRARLARENKARERATKKRVEHGLSRLLEESATLDAMNLALRKLVEDVARRKGPQDCATGWTRRHCEAEILRKYPLEFVCIEDDEQAPEAVNAPRIKGFVRQLSANSLTFEHGEPFSSRLLVATFQLAHGDKFSIVVDVLWTEKDGDGYLSGGTVLAAGTPDDAGQDCQPVAATA